MPVITREDERAEQPSNIKVELMPHQLGLLKACSDYEDFNRLLHTPQNSGGGPNEKPVEFYFRFGIIADQVGAGKSYVALSLINQDKKLKPQKSFNKKIYHGLYYSRITHCEPIVTPNKTSLILVPSATIYQWKMYAENTNTKALIIDTPKSIVPLWKNVKSDYEAYDAIIVTEKRFSEFLNITDFMNIHYRRVFIDEADSIKVDRMATHNFNCDFMWLITASKENMFSPEDKRRYDAFENRYINGGGVTSNISVVKKMMSNFRRCRAFHDYFSFECDPDFIADSIKLEEPIEQSIKCRDPKVIHTVKNVVDSKVIGMINAGDIKGAIKSFGNKQLMKNEEDLVEAITHDLTKKLEEANQKRQALILMPYNNETSKALAITKAESNIKHIQLKINDLKEKMNSNCPICYDDPKPLTITTCCKTKYCFECLMNSLKINGKCPYCRASLTPSDIIIHSKDAEGGAAPDDPNELKDKFEEFKILMDKILSNNKEKKRILVFSDYSQIFAQMKDFVKGKRIKSSEMKGRASGCEKNIKEFNEGTKPVIFLNSKYCGAGLNLENATDIIIYHKLSNDLKMQVIGRAQRYGRKGRLNVWNILNENEMTA